MNGPVSPSSTPQGGAKNATILVVDDTPVNLTVLGDLLQPFYRVRVANSGEFALRSANMEPRPDLILLDIMMPGMDGFEVLRRLQGNPVTADIPVIFVTALLDEEAEQRGFELGAADYIHKPIRGPIVLSRVRVQLDAKAARDMLKKNNQRLTRKVEEGAHALEHAQLQLLQSEKMAAMGQLSAGIAHEINNPIGFVGSNLGSLEHYVQQLLDLLAAYEAAEQTLGAPEAFAAVNACRAKTDLTLLREDVTELVRESREGIERVRRIVKDLKDFARAGDADWQWADLRHGLESTLNILRNELKYHCTIRREYADLPQVWCLPSMLNQVFMNLLVNAGQAIEGQGEIKVRTEQLDEDTVRVSIADTGKGIPAENLSRIFEPFYTTKPIGKGTGLGLPLAWGIVERHRGHLEVVSAPGQGTTFSVTLPIHPSAESRGTAP